tara:strand:- start:2083 stop:3033 length:951 start_codon:yes stop_codon:yes gene_type:complete
MTKFSFSQINTWGKCNYQWHLKYVEGLMPPPTPAMSYGKLGHKMIENILRGEDIHHEIVIGEGEFDTGEIDEVQQLIEDVTASVRMFESSLPLSDWETVELDGVPLIEFPVEVPLDDGDSYLGYIDWVARHKPSGQVWLWDFKFRKSLQADWVEEMDLQKPVYMKHVTDLGINPIGTICGQIKSTAPKKPAMTKKGTLSKAKITTTWEIYRDTVIENGLDIGDYEDMKDKLKDVEFIRLSRSFRTHEELQRTWDTVFIRSVKQIKTQSTSFEPPPRSIGFMNCNNCKFRDICIEDLKGRDTEDLKNQFQRREDYAA